MKISVIHSFCVRTDILAHKQNHHEFARFGLNFYSIQGGEGYTGDAQDIHEYVKNGAHVIGHKFQEKFSKWI